MSVLENKYTATLLGVLIGELRCQDENLSNISTSCSRTVITVCESLIACESINPCHLFNALQKCFDKESLKDSSCLWRSAPLSLWLGPTKEIGNECNSIEYGFVRLASVVPKGEPDSVADCWTFVQILRNSLAGVEPEISIPQRLEVEETVTKWPGKFLNSPVTDQEVLSLILSIIQKTTSFDSAILLAQKSGCTPECGALVGALAGAKYGLSRIPQSLLPNDKRADVIKMRESAKHLLELHNHLRS